MKSKTILRSAMTAGLALSLAGSLYATELWLHMNVKEAKGEHVSLNIPLSTAKGMAGLLGAEAHGGKVRMGDKDMDARELRHLWQAVKDSPDANFVTVDGPEGKVRIAKSGGYLLIRADETKGHNSRVDIKIPAPVIEALISGTGDELNLEAALEALAQHGEGELMTVDDDHDTVRMWVDHSAESNGR
jgi:hypothetical protein